MPAKRPATPKAITTLVHDEARRANIPTAEYQSVIDRETEDPVTVAYERGVSGLEEEKAERDRDLDPQLVWRGKDELDWSDLVVQAPPLYIQEKVHPKVLIDDLIRHSPSPQSGERGLGGEGGHQLDLFADFNGIPEGADRTEFYKHDQNWSNRMILGDSLQVMASLAEREGLRGKVQCIYIDPPYGIRFNSNFQWSTTSRDVKDGNAAHITREPEQVKAFRDTWRDGIHSYLTYLRDRLTVARDLLAESGSIFVQIGDENVHRVRALMDEVFGDDHLVAQIAFVKTTGFSASTLSNVFDTLLWYRRGTEVKYRQLNRVKATGDEDSVYRRADSIANLKGLAIDGERLATLDQLTSQGAPSNLDSARVPFRHSRWLPPAGLHWKTTPSGIERLDRASRVATTGRSLRYVRLASDFSVQPIDNVWRDTGTGSFTDAKIYVVQTNIKIIERCILMTTDPGDLVIDPTCGSGTTAYVAEQWGRRWITIDTSRVALALARARIMGARYPYYLLADSPEGQQKEAEVTRSAPSSRPTYGDIRHGFVYERVPHITLKSIANNAEIDVIWEEYEAKLAPLRAELTEALPPGWLDAYRKTKKYDVEVPPEIQEWEVPRALTPGPSPAAAGEGSELLAEFWRLRIARQKEIDASIAAKADYEYLYDRPYCDNKKVRVAGPFTVESLSPHRILGVDEDGELIDTLHEPGPDYDEGQSFVHMILENLRTSGVQQAHKEDRITFTSLTPWPGAMVCAEGIYAEGEGGPEKRAAIFIGPEFGTVTRPDLVEAARESREAGFDVLIACAFNYDAMSSDLAKLGVLPILKARMNADLHMATDLKNTGAGNLFVVFGEPDVEIEDAGDNQVRVRVRGVDIFRPSTGKVESSSADDIACWFIDTDYNEESFFVRQAYFLGANDPYKALKTTLKAEINEDAWATLHSDTSRAFERPKNGRIAVKVINHLGDEVMKVFRV